MNTAYSTTKLNFVVVEDLDVGLHEMFRYSTWGESMSREKHRDGWRRLLRSCFKPCEEFQTRHILTHSEKCRATVRPVLVLSSVNLTVK